MKDGTRARSEPQCSECAGSELVDATSYQLVCRLQLRLCFLLPSTLEPRGNFGSQGSFVPHPSFSGSMVARVSTVLALMCCSVSAAPSGLNSTSASSADKSLGAFSWQHAGCCSGCPTAFCSPNSGTCYDQKGKYYYLECRSNSNVNGNGNGNGNCCNSCGGSAFCSPNSGRCYSFKGKYYYLQCAGPRRLRGGIELNSTSASSADKSLGASSWQHAGCCSGCPTAFCSPNSGTCYDQKGKYYYLECRSNSNVNGNGNGNCCNSCGGSAFCSPNSGRCYSFKGKYYYLQCAGPRRLRGGIELNSTSASSADKSLGASSWQHAGCCSGCGTAFCSPNSGTCYNQKGKYYYLECRSSIGIGSSSGNSGSSGSSSGGIISSSGSNSNGISSWPHAGCCSGCGTAFCSPNSGRCYDRKNAYYYLECAR